MPQYGVPPANQRGGEINEHTHMHGRKEVLLYTIYYTVGSNVCANCTKSEAHIWVKYQLYPRAEAGM